MIIKVNKYSVIDSLLALLIFSIIVDPSDSILKVKNILFAIIMGLYIFTPNPCKKNAFMAILFLFAVFIFSVFLGKIRGYDFDDTVLLAYSKGWIFYLLLFLAFNPRFSFFGKMFLPCTVISIIIILLYVLVTTMPYLEGVLRAFFVERHDTMINITHRRFLDIDLTGVYYKTTPVLILPLAYSTNLFLNTSSRRFFNFSLSTLFFVALLLAGTRASMFSALFVVGLLFIMRAFKNSLGRLLAIPCLIVFIIFSMQILQKLLNEKEHSINVKTEHLRSQTLLFEEHPDILVFGQGIGSVYYSSGFRGKTSLSELSYVEILRMFGVIGGFIVLLFHISPVFFIYSNKPPNYKAFILGYVTYLLIAGTNPLILNSFGNLVVLTAYSYAYSNNRAVV